MTLEMEIRTEIYKAFEKFGASSRFLAIIGSWGDTLEDTEVLDLLKLWNAGSSQKKRMAKNRRKR